MKKAILSPVVVCFAQRTLAIVDEKKTDEKMVQRNLGGEMPVFVILTSLSLNDGRHLWR